MPRLRIIDRYVGSAVISATVVVLVVLVAIFAFFTFIDELEDLGRGSYGLGQVAMVVALRVPGLAYDLLPIAALIGALLGLGALMERNEIPVVRCAGVSKLRITGSVMKAGLIIVAGAIVVGELIFPAADQYSRNLRTHALDNFISEQSGNGFWARDGNSFINIREILPGEWFRDINILEFDGENHLRIATRAESAHFRDGEWELRGLKQTLFDGETPRSRNLDRASWQSVLDPDLIGMVAINPESLSVFDLTRYVQFIKKNGQSAQRWEQALWVKVAYPVATAAMIFLAIPIVMRHSRGISTGRRIMTGALIGLAFHVLNQASGHLGTVFGVHSAMSALGPTAFVLIAE